MSTTKIKKKHKINCKKAQKLQNMKTMKKVAANDFDEKNIFQDKYSLKKYPKKYSPSCLDENDFSEIKRFSKIREHYFRHLQTVVSKNCSFYNSVVTVDILEKLSLQLEQHAILACLQADIYKKSMCEIINDIKKCNEGRQIYHKIKNLLPESSNCEAENDNHKTESLVKDLEKSECSEIPTISISRTDVNLNYKDNVWSESTAYNTEKTDSYYSANENFQEQSCNSQLQNNKEIVTEINTYWKENENYTVSNPNCSNNYNEEMQTDIFSLNDFQNFVNISQVSNLIYTNTNSNDEIINQKIKIKPISRVPPQTSIKVDPLLDSRNKLQKSVEQTLRKSDNLIKQKREEKEKAVIAQILEGDESSIDQFYDSFSDNENEAKENINETNLTIRLEKMKEIFGVEKEDNEAPIISEKPNLEVNNHINSRSRKSTIWKYEKVIQLHKFSLLSSEMTGGMQNIKRRLLLELFGEDSDEEHENEYLSKEKYITSCTERISSWVVKHLMPFYHDKRIIGRKVFKTLGHHVSESIIDKIQYPDEWTVKYLISKFFPHEKKYACDADVLAYQLD